MCRYTYDFTPNWDLQSEGCMLRKHEVKATERDAASSLHRWLGRNAKLGTGDQWRDISDGLRLIEGDNSGLLALPLYPKRDRIDCDNR